MLRPGQSEMVQVRYTLLLSIFIFLQLVLPYRLYMDERTKKEKELR